MRKLFIGILSTTAIATTAPNAAFASSYDDGVKQYFAGQYQRAVVNLARACGENPSNQMAHYYLANSLVQLRQHDEAIAEYKLTYALNPTGTVGAYCKNALESYRRLPAAAELRQLRSTVFGDTSSIAAVTPQTNNKVRTAAANSSNKVSDCLDVIHRQVEYEKKKNKDIAEMTANSVLQDAQAGARNIENQAKADLEKLYANPPRKVIVPDVDAGQLAAYEAQIKNGAKDSQDTILRKAQATAGRYRKVGDMKQEVLDQVAGNLEKQIADKGDSSGIRLIPEGTDLYVRQYRSVPTSRVLPDAHAAVMRMCGHPGHGNTASGTEPSDAASASKLDPSAPGVGPHSVRGKIIRTKTAQPDS